MKSVLQVESVYKKIGRKKIINDLSFNVAEGEILGFLGPNGSGKTTTIKMIVGLLSIGKGSIRINGYDVKKNFETAMSFVGAIIEEPIMYNHLSGRKNLEMYARMYPNIAEERINQVAKMLNIYDRLGEKVRKYSLGMRQRVGLAQALLHDPKLIILDEPTIGLDPMGVKSLREILCDLAHNHGKSILVSSHALSEMEMLCDRVIIIRDGIFVSDRTLKIDEEEKMKKTSCYDFYVNDVDKAKLMMNSISSKLYMDVDDKLNKISVNLRMEDVPKVNKALVVGDIDVYRIDISEISLEEEFMDATKKSE